MVIVSRFDNTDNEIRQATFTCYPFCKLEISGSYIQKRTPVIFVGTPVFLLYCLIWHIQGSAYTESIIEIKWKQSFTFFKDSFTTCYQSSTVIFVGTPVFLLYCLIWHIQGSAYTESIIEIKWKQSFTFFKDSFTTCYQSSTSLLNGNIKSQLTFVYIYQIWPQNICADP